MVNKNRDQLLDGMLDVSSFDQLTPENVERLARFNGEESRGIVHTDEYRKRMEKLQERFNKQASFSINARRKRWWER